MTKSGEDDVIFCKCGRVAKDNGFCSAKCKNKIKKTPNKGKWSGYSKFREGGGY